MDDLQFASVMKYIELGKSEGATLSTGGGRAAEKGFFVEPTVFSGVTDSMTIAKEVRPLARPASTNGSVMAL